METSHDKCKENARVRLSLAHHILSRKGCRKEHFLSGGMTQNKVAQLRRLGKGCSFVSACWAAKGQRPGQSDGQNMPSACLGKKLGRGKNTCFVAHFLLCLALPFHALPGWRCPSSSSEGSTLKIISSIFNSDYTRQGYLNLITKLEGLKTNPPKSDTVD